MKNSIVKPLVLLMSIMAANTVFAGYEIKIPLEVATGGSLPNGSINLGGNNGTPTAPSSNCEYGPGTYMSELKVSQSGNIAGDYAALYNGQLLGINSPSNNQYMTAGLSKGKLMDSSQNTNNYELCGDNLASYPAIIPPPPPVDPDRPKPIEPPTCIYSQDSDTIVYNRFKQTYTYKSSTFNVFLTNYGKHYYLNPADNFYYYEGEEKTTIEELTYSQICKVSHLDL